MHQKNDEGLTQKENEQVIDKIKLASILERGRVQSNRSDDSHYQYKINADFNIESVEAGHYDLGEQEICVGKNGTVKANITYLKADNRDNNTVNYIRRPGTDATIGGKIWFQNSRGRWGTVIILEFKTKQAYNTFDKFINLND